MSKCSVYVLTNPSLKEVKSLVLDDHGLNVSPVKIGVAKDMPSRLGSLNTPMTENFVVHVQVDLESKESAHFLEKVLHETLDQYRLKTSDGYPTEFFACTIPFARKKVVKWVRLYSHGKGKIVKVHYIGRSASSIRTNLLKAASPKKESAKSDQKNLPTVKSARSPAAAFQFAMLADAGIKVGSWLEFVYGGQNVKVADLKNKIEFEGEVYTTSGFCKKFMPDEKRNSKDAYQGPKYFTFNGELLTELRAKIGM